ncbi:prevent-host-death family protein [Sphingomonas sp. BE270]|jgi:prevent-host-death family protein|uniref:type II toxin-antitoxin system Phd/YefM family antitoxin n=1 Tax=unclassified Sphingomonas TaxID=196159 RepID=UPI00053D3AC2|nr:MULTISPECIES: type II toxin-antitoxin system prevent-host-death family antitoxin [unclassified Sphingomonas]MDR6849783.1 prevent-host-death family protein [Sphingomonas sp. BE137]MDR7257284.1 prevent-host-death family protein [Sphingomonas sp. BE270]
MHISVSDAKAQLTDLVRRAEAGEEITLTRRGHPTVRLTRVTDEVDMAAVRQRRLDAIDRAIAAARERGPDGKPSAARSADDLYDDNGLPA